MRRSCSNSCMLKGRGGSRPRARSAASLLYWETGGLGELGIVGETLRNVVDIVRNKVFDLDVCSCGVGEFVLWRSASVERLTGNFSDRLAITGGSNSPETFSHAADPFCLVLKAGSCLPSVFFGPLPLLPRKLATGKIKVLCAFKDMPRSDEVLDRVLPSGSEALEGKTSANGIFGGRRVDMKEEEERRHDGYMQPGKSEWFHGVSECLD